MCGSCSPLQLSASRDRFLSSVSTLSHLPPELAADIYDAVTDKAAGSHLGEASFLAVITVAVDHYLGGERSLNHGFDLGFLMPLSAHDTRLDTRGVPSARYETGEMKILLESLRRVWMSDTVRNAVTLALALHGLAIPTFACSGIAIVSAENYASTLDWFRQSGWQMRRAEVDQGDRTFGPNDGFPSIETLPETIDLSPAQVEAILQAWRITHTMQGQQINLGGIGYFFTKAGRHGPVGIPA